ncbi:MAG: hypothetical protein HDT22_09525 [Ruminococcus sp.]|nr:hypothetical protein [Ruminococcus sp.]
MKEILTMSVGMEFMNVVQTIQTLNDCGNISTAKELSCMVELFEKLTENDKYFITGAIKGATVALANKTAQKTTSESNKKTTR